ncbi:MAG: hypothetical protein Unbinned4944contig1000_33 [Prokaryotic dsDNA virus sp.]|nr:MAG: hypothetical protein Unbinned4944contig1000_33 [Prokaryotic dsDNA virus sp.]|tara:strand:+ start:4495 stop:4674 length:180 start_codon:yes stop_codon:yes gene_type:complete
MNMYHVIYLEHQKFGAGTLKQKYTRVIANSVPHAIYLAKIKIGNKWESMVDCYLIEEAK